MRTQKRPIYFYCALFLFLLAGCSTTADRLPPGGKTAKPAARGESREEAVSAMEKVLGSVSGEKVDEKKLRELDREIQQDPQAKSAVETIANSVSGQVKIIKYCPVDGERYGPKFVECPVHHVPLKILND